MRSMTGYGRSELERGGIRVLAEVRTLNQRFLEVKLNLPRGWGEYEADFRRLVQSVVARGRVEVTMRSVALKPPPTRLRVNQDLALRYIEELRRLGKRLGLNSKPDIAAILQRPEIFQVVEEETDVRPGAELGFRALSRALKAVDAERMREGRALKRDFDLRVAKIAKALPRIARLAGESRKAIMANFQARVRELLADLPHNEKRLYEEAASAAQHGDITEEITRLRAHLQGLRTLIVRKAPVGKAIEFLLQETNREINTIGAKSQNAVLLQVTVELKGEVEKMREQVQNVE